MDPCGTDAMNMVSARRQQSFQAARAERFRKVHTICPPMGLDDAELSIESDRSGYCCEHHAKYAYGSDGLRQRVGIDEIGDDSWGRWQPTSHGRLDKSRCQAHDVVDQDKLSDV